MPLNEQEVVVGSFGHIYVADAGTALPEDITEALAAIAGADFADLGYIAEDGVSSTFGKDLTDIRAWQSQDPIRRIVNARTGEITCQLMQVNEDTVPFALGGGSWVDSGGGDFIYEFPQASDPVEERVLLWDIQDGDTQIIMAFYRAQVTGDVTSTFQRGAAGTLGVTIGFLSDASAGNIGRIVGHQELTS